MQSHISAYLQSIEPREANLSADLERLAAYMVKIGTNVNLGIQKTTRNRLKKHNLDIEKIVALIQKYRLSWTPKCDYLEFNDSNRCLYQIALNYPQIFIESAARLSPGSYDERRFWWCANNYRFYLNHTQLIPTAHQGVSLASRNFINSSDRALSRPSRLLSDVFHVLLTEDEPKLMTINALHMSIKHSEPQVFHQWYELNMGRIKRFVKWDKFGKADTVMKKKLRRIFKVREAELALDEISVYNFVEWWNLTGLRRPPPGSTFEDVEDLPQKESDLSDCNSD